MWVRNSRRACSGAAKAEGPVEAGGREGLRLRVRRRRGHVLQDEQLLAWLDEPKLPPRQILNRRGILPQPPRFFPQSRILGARTIQRSFEGVILLTCLLHRQEPFFTH